MEDPIFSLEAVKHFVLQLTKLSKETGIIIGGCGCCGSPWISKLDKKREKEISKGKYIINSDGEHLSFSFEEEE